MEKTIIELLGFVGLFGLLYSFADAWHDEKVINKLKKWHTIDAGIKGFVAFSIGFVAWWFTDDIILFLIIGTAILTIRGVTFNFILNKLMGWDSGHKRKKGIDKISVWVWVALLVGLGVLSYFKYYNLSTA